MIGHIEVNLITWLTCLTNQLMAKTLNIDLKKCFRLKCYLIFLSYTGLINAYSVEYEALIDSFINSTSSLNNVSIILRTYNTSERTKLFHQGIMAICKCNYNIMQCWTKNTSSAIISTHSLSFSFFVKSFRFLLKEQLLDSTDQNNATSVFNYLINSVSYVALLIS